MRSLSREVGSFSEFGRLVANPDTRFAVTSGWAVNRPEAGRCRPSDAYLETLAERIGDFINSSREGIAALKSDQLNLSETQSPGYLSP
jgi:hypothetical protein